MANPVLIFFAVFDFILRNLKSSATGPLEIWCQKFIFKILWSSLSSNKHFLVRKFCTLYMLNTANVHPTLVYSTLDRLYYVFFFILATRECRFLFL